MPAEIFVYFALIRGALAKIVHTFLPVELHEAAIDLATGRLLDEFVPARIEEVRKKAAVRGLLGQLILQ